MKSGFVSLVGRPNVGKSTLLNSLLDTHLAITSDKAGTTRNVIQGIYNDDDAQIIFVDTPGIHKPTHKLGNVLNRKAYTSTAGVDLILFLVDAKSGIGRGDEFILKHLEKQDVPVFLLLNKIDKMPREQLLHVIDEASKWYPFQEIIPISGLKKENLDELVKCIKRYLKEGTPYYDPEDLTNVSLRFMVGELVREKVLMLTKDEVPHSVTCLVETYQEDDDRVDIGVVIIVDRDHLKKIIIGKNGQMLKNIGMNARLDIEKLLHKKVYLSTYVKTIENWRDREKYLLELGLEDPKDE